MNKKIIGYMTMFLFIFMIGIINVNAACKTSEKNALKKEAYKLEFDYDVEDGTINPYRFYNFTLKALNTSKNLYITNDSGENFFWREENESAAAPMGLYLNGSKIKLNVYSSSATKCPDTLLYTKTIQFPYYNDYSQREECKGLETYELCQRWFDNSSIDTEEKFLQALEDYKAGKLKNSTKESDKKDFNLIKLLDDNKIIVITVLAVVTVLLTAIKINKSKKSLKVKSLKVIMIFFFLLVFFAHGNVNAGSAIIGNPGGPSVPIQPGWDAYHYDESIAIRLSLYKYDGKKITAYGSVDLANHSFNYNAQAAGGVGKINYTQLGASLGFNQSKKGFNRTDPIIRDFFVKVGGSTRENKLREKIISKFRLSENPEAIANSVNAFFGLKNKVQANEIFDLYITVEPTVQIVIVNSAAPAKYGTTYELNRAFFDVLKNSNGLGSPIKTWYGNYIFAKLNQGHNDKHNFVGNTGNYIIKNEASAKDNNGYEINIDNRSGYGIGIFWLAGELKTCKSTCLNQTGDNLLMCAENYCQQNYKNQGVSKGKCITECGYTVEGLKCPVISDEKAVKTTCEADTQSSKSSCSVSKGNINGVPYSYMIDCNTATKTSFPDLPAAVAQGAGFEYNVAISGSKNCLLTFDYLRWKYDYAAAETTEERQGLITVLNDFNKQSWKNLTYDSKNTDIKIQIDEKLANKTNTIKKTLVVQDKYQYGSLDVETRVRGVQPVYSYYNGIRINASVNTMATSSNNGALYKLPPVCLSYRDSGEIINPNNKGLCTALGTGPYNKIYTSLNAKEDAVNNSLTVVIDGNASGMSAENSCRYINKDVSCDLTTISVPDAKGFYPRGVPLNLELVIIGDRSLIKSYGVDGATKLPTGRFKFVWPNPASSKTEFKINGWIKTAKQTINCPVKINLTSDCPGCNCKFEPVVKNGNKYTVSLSTAGHNATSKYYISFNKGFDVNNEKLQKYYERSNVTFDIADGVTSVHGYVVENGRIHFGQECILRFPDNNNSCTSACLSKDFQCIKDYCTSNPTDGGRYNSTSQCMSVCSLAGTCRQTYACDETSDIEKYCQGNYANEGYPSAVACMNDCGCYSRDYFYRPIDISDPFPDRKEGLNWFGYVKYITEDSDDTTSTGSKGINKAEFVIKLDRQRLLTIRGNNRAYNLRAHQNAYLDYVRRVSYSNPEYQSKFIHDDDLMGGGYKTYFTVINGKEQ